jgi:hypothetical protein
MGDHSPWEYLYKNAKDTHMLFSDVAFHKLADLSEIPAALKANWNDVKDRYTDPSKNAQQSNINLFSQGKAIQSRPRVARDALAAEIVIFVERTLSSEAVAKDLPEKCKGNVHAAVEMFHQSARVAEVEEIDDDEEELLAQLSRLPVKDE